MSAYSIILFLHSWLRWVVLILALVAIVKSLSGWLGNKPFTKSENGIGGAFVGTMHLQLVLGLLLYFVFSAYGFKAISAAGMGEVMKDSTARFWGVEHIFMMILAVVFAQIGRSRSKRAVSDMQKHKSAAIFFIIALLLVLSRIPWTETARLFRGF